MGMVERGSSSDSVQDYKLSFAVGNCKHTSWPKPSHGQLFTHTKCVSCLWYSPLILGKKLSLRKSQDTQIYMVGMMVASNQRNKSNKFLTMTLLVLYIFSLNLS